LQHADYSAQLAFKHDLVENALKKIGGITAEVNQTVAGNKPFGYRNKLALPIGVDGSGNTVIGFYAERSHRIVPITSCAIQADWAQDIIDLTLNFAKLSGYRGFDERTRKGELRHIVVREVDGNYLIVLVVTKPVDTRPFEKMLKEKFQSFSLWLNINTSEGNALFSGEMRLMYGTGFYTATDLGIAFKAGANTFLQVNDEVRTKLYEATVEAVNEPHSVVLDLYSGGGMLTAMLAKNADMAYGIEVVPEASACADELKEMNGLSQKMVNVCGKVEDKIAEIFAKTQGKKRVVVCDPPRKGMERSVVMALREALPDKIVLISCNPSTLARDLGILLGTLKEENGTLVKQPNGAENSSYRIKSVTPFDMFPQTKHVETLISLCRK
jgi:23S rRNA (uracil1939-C5)-methyltransferase